MLLISELLAKSCLCRILWPNLLLAQGHRVLTGQWFRLLIEKTKRNKTKCSGFVWFHVSSSPGWLCDIIFFTSQASLVAQGRQFLARTLGLTSYARRCTSKLRCEGAFWCKEVALSVCHPPLPQINMNKSRREMLGISRHLSQALLHCVTYRKGVLDCG